jgi:hypothetical protein
MQGRRLLLAALSGLAVLLLASPTLASLSAPMGWYVEPNIGLTKISNQTPSGSVSGAGIGGNLNVGYKFMPYFTTELGYTLYANTGINSGGARVAKVRRYSYDLAGKGIIPFGYSGTEGFAKLGIMHLVSHTSITNSQAASNIGLTGSQNNVIGLYLGAGGQYYFTPQLAGIMQWARAIGNNSTGTIDLWSIGISFIFD